MALATTTVWEVRSTGSDNNGGGFVPGSGGTDYSQQDAAEYSFADLASSNGTAAAPAVTSASRSFSAADVGNILHITAGTSWTVGYYEIVSVASGAATLDRACGSVAALSSGSYAVGGALASMAGLAAAWVGQNTAWIKAQSIYPLNAGFVIPGGSWPGYPTQMYGYGTTRGDGSQATIQTASGASSFLSSGSGGCYTLKNLVLDANKIATNAFSDPNGFGLIDNCSFENSTSTCFNNSGSYVVIRNSLCLGTPAGAVPWSIAGSNVLLDGCSTTGGSDGIYLRGIGDSVLHCNISNVSNIGIYLGATCCAVRNCNVYNSGGNGIQSMGDGRQCLIENNIVYGSGGYGLEYTQSAGQVIADYNAYGANTSGNYDSTYAPGLHDVVLTASPFTDPANGDFSLNDDPGGGALLKGKGYPGTLPYGGTGYADIGALQHQDSGGSAPGPFPFHSTLNILPQ